MEALSGVSLKERGKRIITYIGLFFISIFVLVLVIIIGLISIVCSLTSKILAFIKKRKFMYKS